jgi:hypothetical protein
MTDKCYAYAFGTWGDAKRVMSKVRKFHKDGFYVTIDEITHVEFSKLWSYSKERIPASQSFRHILSDGIIAAKSPVKHPNVFHVRLYGPDLPRIAPPQPDF